ncbi:MAG TPA: bifunctional serine/threonine-protein kinase/ABC transporter substrate-binding protein [Ktedonobacteraceae bacterium]
MECPYCRTVNRDGTTYCNNCGKFIGSSPSSSSSGSVSNTTGSSSLSSPSRSLAIGARLQGGRYIVKQILGQGGMGAALLATDIRLDSKSVVIKELISDSVDPARLQEDVRNFKREVATLAHIDHPLVPSVTDHFQEGNRYFMVQEYIEGENLENQIERTHQPLREREALICASQILDILDYLTQQTPPIVHRDIKPANIIIGSRDKRAHLVDFGIARPDIARNAKRKQTSGLGTPGYAPPEQYQGNADPRSDLYALAATLHHLLTNRDPRDYPPFNYPPVRILNPQLSPEVEQVLMRTLNNDITQRYQSAVAMKQDIDTILRQRYGVSGNIDSYTLGTSTNSGAMSAIQDLTMPSSANQSTFVKAPTTAPAPVTSPMSQLTSQSGLSNLSAGYSQLSNTPGTLGNVPLPPQRRRRTGLAIVIVIVLLLFLSGGGYFTFMHFRSSSPAGIGVTEIGNEPIGISDGSFAFDTTLADGTLKSQAAQLYKQSSSNVSQVTALLNQAIAKNSNDAEALIYQEDLRVVNSGSPYVTVVVATFLSGSNIGVGRDDLQGAYVAQKEFNDASTLPGGVQVRLLIANLGSKTDYVSNITQQIAQLAQDDKTFVGVMGMPFSSYALSAIRPLSSAKIPLVSQGASADELTNASPYFFRVVPSNQQQGIQGAQYAINTLHSKNVALFYDQQNSYSQSLAQDFQQEFQKDGGQVVVEEKYTVGQPGTLPAKLQDALKKKPDLIYFSGYASDVSTLLANQLPDNLPILGGDALYELGGYSSSARASGFTHLHFTAFAFPDQWGAISQKPQFLSEYPQDFDPNSLNQGSPYGFTRADNDAILSYDATVTILSGCNIALSSGKQSITPEDLQQALKKLNGANAIQGVSGQIALGPDGNPINKAIVLLSVDSSGHLQLQKVLGQFLK